MKRPAIIAVTVAAALCVIVVVFRWRAHGHLVAYGDVPTWATFFVVLIGLPAALYELTMQRVQLRDQQEAMAAEAVRNSNRDALLDGQLRELQQREQAATRDHAQRISGWYSGETSGPNNRSRITVLNASDEPVYQAVVTLVFIQGARPQRGENYPSPEMPAAYRRMLWVIPPGRSTTTVSPAWHGMQARAAAEVAFTDRAGIHWVRRADGTLEELPVDPIAHFEIERPVNWETPQSQLEAAESDASRHRDLDETRRLAYMALIGTSDIEPELVATLVNALAHHGLGVDPEVAARRLQALSIEENRRWLQQQIEQLNAELGS